MITLPIPFLSACRHLVNPAYRIFENKVECAEIIQSRDGTSICFGDVIITADLLQSHPDTEFFRMKKWPSMDPGCLTIKNGTLHYAYKNHRQTTMVEPITQPEAALPEIVWSEESITPDQSAPLMSITPFQSKDETRYVLIGALCSDAYIATDGRRLLNLSSSYTGTPFIMPSAILAVMIALHLKKPAAYWRWNTLIDDNNSVTTAKIETDSYTVQFKAVYGNFPNWKQVIPAIDYATSNVKFIPNPSSIDSMATWLRGRAGCMFIPHEGNILLYDVTLKSHAIFPGYLSTTCCYNGTWFKDMLSVPGFHQMYSVDKESPAIFEFTGGMGVLMPIRSTVDVEALLEDYALTTA